MQLDYTNEFRFVKRVQYDIFYVILDFKIDRDS